MFEQTAGILEWFQDSRCVQAMRCLVFSGLILEAALLGTSPAQAQHAPHDLGYLYLSPAPGAYYVSAQTRYVLVRLEGVSPSQVTNLTTSFITVQGELSGIHAGATHVASDGRTVIFSMGSDFFTNEAVTVTFNPLLAPGTKGAVSAFRYQFMVNSPFPQSTVRLARAKPQPGLKTRAAPRVQTLAAGRRRPRTKAVTQPNGISVPGDFPRVVMTVNSNPSPGNLWIENATDGVPPFTMIVDNNGYPVWYRLSRMLDFKVQKNGTITWCSYDDNGLVSYTGCDQSFNYLQTYVTTNGYLTDGHELKVLPDGSYLMIGSQVNIVDLSLYIVDGSMAFVTETVVQQFTAAGELIFQWRAWDNYNIADLGGDTDFPHLNGLDLDDDCNLLVSARHLSEVTKVDLGSGDVIWRLSGAHSSFEFVGDPLNGTSFQHNISSLGHGHYLVFDNGNSHTPEVSRAVEYLVDLTDFTARPVWQFRDQPDKFAFWMGSAQRLPTGNTLIDFALAQYPKAIEVDANGQKQFELSLVPGADSYRAFRFPWQGVVAAPYLVIDEQPDNVTLIFNKFGDTNVSYYRIYGGPSPNPTDVIAKSTTTLLQLTNLANGLHYFRVTAVNSNEVETPFSNEESATVVITPPGQNIVKNGDFSQGTNSWSLLVSGGGVAAWAIDSHTNHVSVSNGGTSFSSVQLLQPGCALALGSTYNLEFDAWSSRSHYINLGLVQSSYPLTRYINSIYPLLTPVATHYRYTFTMENASDFSVNLLFNLGSLASDVYLANVSLVSTATDDLNADGRVDFLDLGVFARSWMKKGILIPADLNGDDQVDFNDFDIFGQNWR
jgi:hypothetical protein